MDIVEPLRPAVVIIKHQIMKMNKEKTQYLSINEVSYMSSTAIETNVILFICLFIFFALVSHRVVK